VAKNVESAFDPKLFLATVNRGHTVSDLRKEMLHVLHAEPSFSELFMTHLLTRNSRVEEDLVDQLFNLERKAAGADASPVGECRQGRRPQPITTRISQETLAEIIGSATGRSTTSCGSRGARCSRRISFLNLFMK
jgi:hypothetical protein